LIKKSIRNCKEKGIPVEYNEDLCDAPLMKPPNEMFIQLIKELGIE
jgi:hypothetical protein